MPNRQSTHCPARGNYARPVQAELNPHNPLNEFSLTEADAMALIIERQASIERWPLGEFLVTQYWAVQITHRKNRNAVLWPRNRWAGNRRDRERPTMIETMTSGPTA